MKNLYCLLYLFLIGACSSPSKVPRVKKKLHIETRYHDKTGFSLRKRKVQRNKLEYTRYNKQGRELEIGTYGETTRKHWISNDPDHLPVHTSGTVRNYKKLNTLTTFEYRDSLLISSQHWKCRNNKKQYLEWRYEYDYNDQGQYIGFAVYNDQDSLIRSKRKDPDSPIIEQIKWADEKEEIPSIQLFHNRKGLVKLIKYYDEQGRITSKTRYRYRYYRNK